MEIKPVNTPASIFPHSSKIQFSNAGAINYSSGDSSNDKEQGHYPISSSPGNPAKISRCN